MNISELTVNSWLDHLKAHPLPELMDEECLAALENVRAEYGHVISHGAGLEVRLSEEDRYVDYIMNIDTKEVPMVGSLWYELDYAAFKSVDEKNGERIIPCLFANIYPDKEDGYSRIWDRVLPAMMGESRASLLRRPLEQVVEALPRGAYIKQIGSMSSRGELDVMRLVILFPSWEDIGKGLKRIGWDGDPEALDKAFLSWREPGICAVNIDLGEKGVLPKIGIEIASRWRQPILVDKVISRFEEAGLCIPSKGRALRRWIRLRPQGDPFIQTLIAYYKMNYKDGRITEVKAYLEQTPYIHHHYFESFENPIRLDIELWDGKDRLSPEKACLLIGEAADLGVGYFYLYHPVDADQLGSILNFCEERKVIARVIYPCGVTAGDSKSIRFTPGHNNIGKLKSLEKAAEKYGWKEIILTSDCTPEGSGSLTREDFAAIAELIKENESLIRVDSCLSPLRAYLGGEDVKGNPNRGIERGCMAGRAFFAIHSDGSFTPCLRLKNRDKPVKMKDYWESLASDLHDTHPDSCEGCCYKRRCLPCPQEGDLSDSGHRNCRRFMEKIISFIS